MAYHVSLPRPAAASSRYGNVVSKSAADTGAPSVNGTLPTGAFAGVHRPEVDAVAADRQRIAQRGPSPRAARCPPCRRRDDGRSGTRRDRRRRHRSCSGWQPGVAGMPVLSRVISDGVTLASWFTPGNPVRNAVDQVVARQVVRREIRDVRAQRLVHRSAEQHVEQRRQRRVRHVGGELTVEASARSR